MYSISISKRVSLKTNRIMRMKYFIGLVLSIVIFTSCGREKKITYSTYFSVDNSYSVEVPSDATQEKCILDLMSFENTNSHLTITVQQIDEGSIGEYIRKEHTINNSFSYNLFLSSDTTSFYKVTRGNNMWSAYDLYMLKCLDGKNYLLNVSSDVLSQSEIIEIIKHIYISMKLYGMEKGADNAIEEAKVVSLEKTYSTKFYSVKYPKGWNVIEPFDEMTEAYIGHQPENFGFTIVRFKTDYTLSEVNAEGNENLRQAGFRILEEKQMTVDRLKCHRAVIEIPFQGQKVKQISYTFKKGDTLYNVKFGSVTTKKQDNIATKIIDSFRFK